MKKIFGDSQLNFLAAINVLVLLSAVAFTGWGFIDPYNLQSMAGQVPELGLLAMGVMLAMIAGNGGIDLSGIALANLAAVTAGTLVPQWVSPTEAPLLFTASFAGVALTVGLVGGCMNGALIAYARLPSILCTLGTQLVFTGFAVVLSGGSAVRIGFIEPLEFIGNGLLFGVPLCFALFIGLAVAIGAWLRYSPSGVRLFLMGTNLKAARYAGIAQQRLVFLTYLLCGLLAAVAGIIIAARSSSAKWDYGSSYVLIAILIAVMAGVRPEGGYGRMICLVLSATALQFLSSTFNFLEVNSFFRDLAWGSMLLLFVASSRISFLSLLKTRPGARLSSPQLPPPAAISCVEGLKLRSQND
jgi:simple sugar transport system permease protein